MDCITAQKLIPLYIERRLDGEELEDFLDHIEHCASCCEELEVYFTIYYALKQLEDEQDDTSDMKQLFRQDLSNARSYLLSRDTQHFLTRCVLILSIISVFLLLGIILESYLAGGYTRTKLYSIVGPEIIIFEPQTETSDAIEIEVETNHKKELIITIPETEKHTEPGLIPDQTGE